MLLATGRVAAVGITCTWHPGHSAAARTGPYLDGTLATGSRQTQPGIVRQAQIILFGTTLTASVRPRKAAHSGGS
jgi:hypothetical protein